MRIIFAAFCLLLIGAGPANSAGQAASLIAGGAQVVGTATFNDGSIVITLQQGKRAWVCLLEKSSATYETRWCYTVD